MTAAKRKAKILLLQQNKTFADVARDAGLSLASIHNVLDGRKSSRKSKQAITNALGATVFEDIEVTERRHTFPKGCRVAFLNSHDVPDIALAKQWVEEFPGFVRRRGAEITFTKATPVKINTTNEGLDIANANLAERRSATRTHRLVRKKPAS